MDRGSKQILTKDQIEDYKFRYRNYKNNKSDADLPSDREKYFNPESYSNRSSFRRIKTRQDSKDTLRREKPYKIYTTVGQYDDLREQDEHEKEEKKKKYYRDKLPQIKTVRYVIRKKVNSNNQSDKLLFNFMNPTVNSLLNSRKIKSKPRNDLYKKLCSVDCINKSQSSSRVKTKKKTSDGLQTIEQRIYYPTLRQYLLGESRMQILPYEHQNRLRREKEYMIYKEDPYFKSKFEEYQMISSKKINFSKLETQYARQLFSQQSDVEYPQSAFKNEFIPKIPSKELLSDFINNYYSKNEDINIQKLTQSPYFIIEYSPNELFFGQMIGNDKSGKGILIEENRVFQGFFRNGAKVKGVETNLNGVYKGEYYRDKREGNGEFEWFNGEYYLGEWKEGKRHGNGLWLNRFGDSYNGSWKNGKGEGYGVYVVKDQKYKGEFLNFLKHGWGKQTFPNGDKFQGNFREGFPEGSGIYTWSDGTTYEGEFKGGLRQGKGILRTCFDLIYQGEYYQQKPQGLCQILMPNGDLYKGMFKHGRKNGRGVLTLERTKKILDGYWQDDKFVDSVVY